MLAPLHFDQSYSQEQRIILIKYELQQGYLVRTNECLRVCLATPSRRIENNSVRLRSTSDKQSYSVEMSSTIRRSQVIYNGLMRLYGIELSYEDIVGLRRREVPENQVM